MRMKLRNLVFDKKYWAKVDNRAITCKNCGNAVAELKASSTGWTHTGTWEGIRCQGQLCGAEPARRK